MAKAGIYLIRILATNAIYVGQAVDIPKRWAGHRRKLAAGTHHNRQLQEAWTSGGTAAVVFELLQSAPERLTPLEQQRWLAEQEKKAIQQYRAQRISVNQTSGEIVATKAAEAEFKEEQARRKKAHNSAVTTKIRAEQAVAGSLRQQLDVATSEWQRTRGELCQLEESVKRSTGLRRLLGADLPPAGVAAARQRIIALKSSESQLKTRVEKLNENLRTAQKELMRLRGSYWGTSERNYERFMLKAGFRVRKERIR
jgi:chromosome segregation ATPase